MTGNTKEAASRKDQTPKPGFLQGLVGLRIEAWKKRFGEDVKIKMCYMDGSYYRDNPAQWFGETKRFRVGPCAHVDDVLSELTRLHSKPNDQTHPTAAVSGRGRH